MRPTDPAKAAADKEANARLSAYVTRRIEEIGGTRSGVEKKAEIGNGWISKLQKAQLRGRPKVSTLEALAVALGDPDASAIMRAAGYLPSAHGARERGHAASPSAGVRYAHGDMSAVGQLDAEPLGPFVGIPVYRFPPVSQPIFAPANVLRFAPWPVALMEDGGDAIVEVVGDELEPLGAQPGDRLLVDRTEKPQSGDRVLAVVNGACVACVYRGDAVEALPSAAPWRATLGPGVRIEAVIIDIIKRVRQRRGG